MLRSQRSSARRVRAVLREVHFLASSSHPRHHARRRMRINLLPSVSGRVFVVMRRMSVRMRIRRRITQIRILRRRVVVLRAICPIKASTCNKRSFIHPCGLYRIQRSISSNKLRVFNLIITVGTTV